MVIVPQLPEEGRKGRRIVSVTAGSQEMDDRATAWTDEGRRGATRFGDRTLREEAREERQWWLLSLMKWVWVARLKPLAPLFSLASSHRVSQPQTLIAPLRPSFGLAFARPSVSGPPLATPTILGPFHPSSGDVGAQKCMIGGAFANSTTPLLCPILL